MDFDEFRLFSGACRRNAAAIASYAATRPSTEICGAVDGQVTSILVRKAFGAVPERALWLHELRVLDAQLLQIGLVPGGVVIELAHLRPVARHELSIHMDLRLCGVR